MKFSNILYQRLAEYILAAGRLLEEKRGKSADIGVRKRFLTEEDIKIEREIKKLILDSNPNHKIYGEEENNQFQEGDDIWVIDPISGTKLFIENKPHYAIIASHIHKGAVMFAIIHDPSSGETFHAELGKGAFLDEKRINVISPSGNEVRLILNKSSIFHENAQLNTFLSSLKTKFSSSEHGNLSIELNGHSMGLNYCKIACGQYNGVIAFTKDIFPEVAGSLIVTEAGGSFWNLGGEDKIRPTNKVFICGDKTTSKRMYKIFEKEMNFLRELESLDSKP